ncbi:MAG: WS/DGAT/MGAT family O-acyltransferase [Marmoricola sp.]
MATAEQSGRLLSPLDQMFVRMESPRTPMHIGALAIFTLPPGAPEDFVRSLHAAFSEMAWLPFPYDSELSSVRLADAWRWKQVQPDPDYHIRLDALPSPGSEADLGRLVERLHSRPLDMTKPLWEAHIIEGLEGDRFAFYFKAHHCATDGLGAVETITAWLSTDPTAAPPTGTDEAGRPLSLWDRLTIIPRRAVSGTVATVEVLGKIVDMTIGANSTVIASLKTPKSLLNQRVTPHRRVATQSLPLPTLRAVAKAADVTVNDVVLAALGGAMRRYLLDLDALPDATLNASVPVGFARGEETRNAAAGFVAPLGTQTEDPRERLAQINAATRRAKADIDALSPGAAEYFSLIGLVPLALAQKSGLLAKLPPLFNLTVSNVVLSKEPLYLLGAELQQIVPISFLVDGYALNVTLIGYTDKVTLGIVGCREALPHLQRLATYTTDALAELATAVGVA